MADRAPLGPEQVASIEGDLRSIGNTVRTILGDPDMALTDDQSDLLASQLTALGDAEANLATQSALVTFADANSAFGQIGGATKAASAKLDALEKNLAKISSTIAIVAAAISLGTAFASGNAGSIISAASNLASRATSA